MKVKIDLIYRQRLEAYGMGIAGKFFVQLGTW